MRLASSITAKMTAKVTINPALISKSLSHTEWRFTDENQSASV